MSELERVTPLLLKELRDIGYYGRVTGYATAVGLQFVCRPEMYGRILNESLYAAKRAAPGYFPTASGGYILLAPLCDDPANVEPWDGPGWDGNEPVDVTPGQGGVSWPLVVVVATAVGTVLFWSLF